MRKSAYTRILGDSMRKSVSVLACVAALLCSGAYAQTLTAVCSNPKGWAVGYERGKPEAVEDGFSGASFTYSWKFGEKTATVISQNSQSAGGSPTTESAAVVPSKEFVTFVVVYQRGVWMHTLFPVPGVVMISRHTDGRGDYEHTAAGGLFHATCKMSGV